MFRALIARNCSEHYKCACCIAEYVRNTWHKELSDEELVFLTIHLKRIRMGSKLSCSTFDSPQVFPVWIYMLDTNLRKGELKMKDKIFGVLQRVGRSFMLPIALLPVAGLLLGIGSSFTNETMLAAYGLNSVIHPGTLIYTILDVMSQTGSAVFNNLALLFAMGVAIGMARKEKRWPPCPVQWPISL